MPISKEQRERNTTNKLEHVRRIYEDDKNINNRNYLKPPGGGKKVKEMAFASMWHHGTADMDAERHESIDVDNRARDKESAKILRDHEKKMATNSPQKAADWLKSEHTKSDEGK